MSAVASSEKTQAWGNVQDLINAAESSKKPAAPADLANKDVFMKPLVAQLKNQNPTSPADGIQFITQLAQFTQLEQSMAMRQDVQAIRNVITETDAAGQQQGK